MDKFHQCLHGYSNKKGHHKIAASISLSRQSEQVMLSMSDRSGSLYNGFKEYITLYSLDSEKEYQYALAKTWEAREIRRPGCVWTHTILFTQKLKDIIQDLYPLMKYFRHPLEPDTVDASFYEKELGISDLEIKKNHDSSDSDRSKKQLIQACLNENNQEKPIVVRAKNAKEYEKLVFEIWSSQKDLTFCTGALSIREISKRPLRVQVVPKKINYRSDMYFINEHNQVIPDKSHITEKVKLFQFIDRLSDDDKVIDQIIQFIKKIVSNNSVFLELFEAAVNYIKQNKHYSLHEIDLFKAYIKYQSDFDGSLLNLSERTRQLYESFPKEAVDILFDNLKNSQELPKIICNGIARAIIEIKIGVDKKLNLLKSLNFFLENFADKNELQIDIQFFIDWQKSNKDIPSIIKLFKKYYPDKKKKKALKKAFLGSFEERTYFKKKNEEHFLLSAFAEFPKLQEYFDENDLLLKKRVKFFWNEVDNEKKKQLIKIVFENRCNELAKIMFSEIVRKIDTDTSKYFIFNQDLGPNKDCNKYLLKKIISSREEKFYLPILENVRQEDTELKQFLIEEFKLHPETPLEQHIDKSRLIIKQMIESGYNVNELISINGKRQILNIIKQLDIELASKKFGEIADLKEFDIIDFFNHIELSIEAGSFISDIKWTEIAKIIHDGNSEQKNDLMLYFLTVGFQHSHSQLVSTAFNPVCAALTNKEFESSTNWKIFQSKYLEKNFFSRKNYGKQLTNLDYLHFNLFKLFSEGRLKKVYFNDIIIEKKLLEKYFLRFQHFYKIKKYKKIYKFIFDVTQGKL